MGEKCGVVRDSKLISQQGTAEAQGTAERQRAVVCVVERKQRGVEQFSRCDWIFTYFLRVDVFQEIKNEA